jgi:hypothetical protein
MKKYLRLALFAGLIIAVQFVQFFMQLFTGRHEPQGAILYADVPAPPPPPPELGTNCVDAGSADSGGGVGGDGADGGGCFPANTLVSTPDGMKKIQELQIGDSVYGFDIETGAVVTSIITETTKHSWEEMGMTSPLVVVTHEKGALTLTTNHPVYKKGSTSVEGHVDFENAGNLKVGDVLTTEKGELTVITNIVPGAQYDYVYNIEVDAVHTYNAEEVRVHNKV